MFKFSFIINSGEHAGEIHTYSVKAKNYNDANDKARQWCAEANCTFRLVTRIK